VGRNPRAAVFSPNGKSAYVANALDDSITVLETSDFTIVREIPIGGPAEVTRLRRGERVFHSAAMTFGRQFSCRTCHPEGHTNGLAFDIEADGIGTSPLQVRTLRGILDTPPFKWEGTNPSLSAQCGSRLAVFFTRLTPIPPDDLDALVRYISTIERPDNPYRRPDGLTLAQRRGKTVFERTTTNSGDPISPEQRCATCHNTPSYTARNRSVVGTTMWLDMPVEPGFFDFSDSDSFGRLGIVYFYDTGAAKKAFDAPHLNNVYDRAPYLHNGSAATLEEIWTRFNLYEAHGLTGDLTRRQFNDLIAYVKSL
jgi:cytochrome c peroxidase